MRVQAFVPQAATERFHERIVCRLAGPAGVQRHAVLGIVDKGYPEFD